MNTSSPDPVCHTRRRLVLLGGASAFFAPALWAKETAAIAVADADEKVPLSSLDAARLERFSWGATPGLLVEVQKSGFDRWLQAQMKPGPAVLPAAVQAQIAGMQITRQPMVDLVRAAEDARNAISKDGSDEDKKAAAMAHREGLQEYGREAVARSLLMQIYSPNQLQEQMTWFWMNHFSIGASKRNVHAMIADYENGMRAKSLGRFRELLDASVFHPAMLSYLDNANNVAGRINENYARELLELHTMGVGSGYTQQDVQELARVLTGLGVERVGNNKKGRPRKATESSAAWHQGMVVFDPALHESGDRVVLGRKVTGKGIDGIREVLDRLAAHPATARYISFKLAQFFVADAPSDALVDTMKARFLSSGGDISSVLQAMFSTKEFEASLGRKFKDPQHYVVSALRMTYGGSDAVIANARPMMMWLNQLGQVPYGRKTPDGWPMTEAAWASSGQMNVRFEVARMIGDGPRQLFEDRPDAKPGKVAAAPVNNGVWRTAYVPRLSPATRKVLAEAQGKPADWNALALSSPEFMRR